MCEKPLAPTAADCLEMSEACRQNGVKLMVAYRLHFEPGTVEMVHRIRAGDIGDVPPRPMNQGFRHRRENAAKGR